MASARNMVVAGDYQGCYVGCINDQLFIKAPEGVVYLTIFDIETHQLVTEEKGRSITSGIVRGLIGGLLFQTPGLIGGVLLAKNDKVYQVSVEFKNGKRSLIEMDSRRYNALVRICY